MTIFTAVLVLIPVAWIFMTMQADKHFDSVILFWKWKNNEETKYKYYLSYVLFWLCSLVALAVVGWFCHEVIE